jgi:glycosyltransferase involved in cell wall biosynthesis
LRVLMISDFYHPFIGGVEQHVRSLSSTLALRGHDVAVATLGRHDLPEVDEDQGVRIHRMQGSAQRIDRLFSSTGRPWAPPLSDPELTWALRRVIASEQPDIVHGHDWLSRSFLPLKRWSGAKFVSSLHYYTLSCAKKNLLYGGVPCSGPETAKCTRCATDHYGRLKGLVTVSGGWAGASLERRAADMFIAVSAATAEGNGLIDGVHPFRVIPNFLPPSREVAEEDLAPYVAALPRGEFLLYVGDLRSAKGLNVLLDAYSRFENAPPLVLIGKVWPETPTSFPNNVIVLKDWPNFAVIEAWRRATIGLIPSVWPEPFGIVAIEAMAGGCPVVASRLGGLPDIVVDDETGLLVPPADPSALHTAIDQLLRQPDRIRQLGQAARERARQYEADAVVPQIEGVYQELLGEKSQAGNVSTPQTLFAAESKGTMATHTSAPTVVSIVVNNYNYERFLSDAIDSALNQTHEHTEVIVVDDGSTDSSREIIARYGDRIVPVLKENGGQASAFNAGFERSSGDIVIFLDSDDMLLSHVAEAVVHEFEQDPAVAKIQYRLEMVDALGRPIGLQTPPAELSMPEGDLRHQILRYPDDVRTPPTSGNAFRASMLRQILPMPNARDGTTGADLYLSNITPLYGLIKTLPGTGGKYRVHESNNFYTADLNTSKMHHIILCSAANHDLVVEHARKLRLENVPQHGSDLLSVTFLVNRLASKRLDPDKHPIEGDNIVKLAWLGIVAASRRVDVPVRMRLMYMLWFVAAAGSPKRLTRWLIMNAFHVERRGVLSKVV